MELSFRSLAEDRIGATWRQVFDHGWPGWKAWYDERRGPEPVPVGKCRGMLRHYMPGLERSWDGWVEAVGGGEDVARFLSFWSPPRYLVNCSQFAGSDAEGPFLIRNYDLDPALNEGTLLLTGWHGHRVIGMVEGMAGLSDGVNDAGLALSLTFGGRIARGPGFGIPLILRYVLESCRDTQDALAAFREIPCHMSYNVTAIDRAGRIENMMLAPDRPLVRRDDCWATNHQLGVEWPRHGRLSQTLERGELLRGLASDGRFCADDLVSRFLAPPLHARRYGEGFGTVFTALYRPAQGRVSLIWGDGARHDFGFDHFPARRFNVRYNGYGSAAQAGDDAHVPGDEARRLAAIAHRNTLESLDGWTNLNPLPGYRASAGEPQ